MLHQECPEGRTLLEAYLEAICQRDALRSAPPSGTDTQAVDAKIAQDMVRTCRALYWKHVREHGCREGERC
jgi:hypothetical protein